MKKRPFNPVRDRRVHAGADVLCFLFELRAQLKASGLTQATLADRIGVRRSQVSRWLREDERGLTAKSMFLLARGLGFGLRQVWVKE